MLKISIQEDADTAAVKIEGRVVGPWVTELDQAWQALSISLGTKKLQLDICGVTFVDSQGKQILREIFQATNAEIIADTPLTKQFADETRRQMPKEDGEET